MRHCGFVGASVRATAPESRSSVPPLEFSTRAVPVNVKMAWSPLRSPTSLKSSKATVATGGFVAACAAAMSASSQNMESSFFMCGYAVDTISRFTRFQDASTASQSPAGAWLTAYTGHTGGLQGVIVQLRHCLGGCCGGRAGANVDLGRSFGSSVADSLPGDALRLPDHPFQLLGPRVSPINLRHAA